MKSNQSAAAGKRRKFPLKLKIALILTVVVLLVVGIVGALVWIKRQMFEQNPRFLLQRLEIKAPAGGYWSAPSRDRLLWRQLQLAPGQNLFALNLSEIRQKLRNIPSIKDVEVYRIYPDTLRLEIIERIPRALLKSPQSQWVIDDDGVIMRRAETVARSLPVIDGPVPRSLKAGDRLEFARPAITLILTVAQSYRSIDLIHIQVVRRPNPNYNYLEVALRYHKVYCKLLLPATGNRRDYQQKIIAFTSAIDNDARMQGQVGRVFDLRYSDQVVISK